MKTDNSSMYSGTPCDVCGGPTLRLERGSIWCPAEDKRHPGGHFVIRVAFERSPIKGGSVRPTESHRTITPRTSVTPSRVVRAPAREGFGGGIDDFVSSDES